ncbi:MAG: penicillin-binding transpeptidase domain-containing protein [Negativicutes bacterium]|nr:penicillin-binding transpeptidase domain-containing protein [Negativicutes bacterium]
MFDNIARNIRRVALVFAALFTILFVYISYLQTVQADFLAGHALNRRTAEAAKRIPRGQITDRHGQRLVFSERDQEGQYNRKYPYGAIFAPVLGYDSLRYGRAGLESTFNTYLSGLGGAEHRLGPISKLWQPKAGNNLQLTLDASVQERAYYALGDYRGAVVVIAPKTGAILAMVSKPGFDANSIDENWPAVSSREDSPLLNRAAQGLYPPGSTIKTLVAEAVLTDKVADLKTSFNCEGALKIGRDYVLPEINRAAHGKINLQQALAVSCNVTFGKLAIELGAARMEKAFGRYGFTKPIGSEFEEAGSKFPDFSKLSDGELAQAGIGQGPLLTTPLRMAMLAAAFANRGVIMKPFMVSKVTTPDGAILKEYTPEAWLTAAKAGSSEAVAKMMETVVTEGTGTAVRIRGIRVAGKTGTAENPHGAPHAWFIGFAPADNPEIAVAVIVENAGGGGAVAAPIARQVILEALH